MLAEELGFSCAQIYAMIKRNEIGYVRRPGGHIRILQKHIDEWIARNECPAQPKEPASSDGQEDRNGKLLTATATSARVQRAALKRNYGANATIGGAGDAW